MSKNNDSIKNYYKSETDGTNYTVKVKAVKKTLEADGSRIIKYVSSKDTKNVVDKLDADGNVIGYKVETKAQVEERLFKQLYARLDADGFVIMKP